MGTSVTQDWPCRRCRRPLGAHDGQRLRLTRGRLLAVGMEHGELYVRCGQCQHVQLWWPARVPVQDRGMLGPVRDN